MSELLPHYMSSEPIDAERRALQAFVSTDTTRPHLTMAWKYVSDGGITFVATDAHTFCIRRWGTHKSMSLWDIERLPSEGTWPLQPLRPEPIPKIKPPVWAHILMDRDSRGNMPKTRGINVRYVARVGLVEAACTKRDQRYFEATSNLRGTARKSAKAQCLTFAVLELYGELDPWYFVINGKDCLWEVLIMPRRV